MYSRHFSIINNSLIQTSLITTPPIIILINYKQLNFKILTDFLLRFPKKVLNNYVSSYSISLFPSLISVFKI